MTMTMALPEPLHLVVNIIQKTVEISPESDKVFVISLWDFRNKNGDLIPKDDLKQILRLLEEKNFLQIVDMSCLNKRGRFAGEEIKIKIGREKLLTVNNEAQIDKTEGLFTWGELSLNLLKGTMQYKNNKPKEITPEQDEIKFLVLLMKADTILEYKEIAKELEMNCYHDGVTNSDVAREVNFIRRNLVTILKDTGMSDKDIKLMILTKRKAGYKLQR